MKRIKALFEYREMIFSLVKRDLRGQYKGSVLGFFWTFLNPLLQLIVYTIVFSLIMRAGIEHYYMFLFVALVPWVFFSASLSGGSGCILAQQSLVKKIFFPREVLPVSYVTSQFVNMLLSFVVIAVVMLVTRFPFKPYGLPYLPIVMIVEYLLALGFVFLLSALTVYLRDIQYVIGVLMMLWQFLSPVMYAIDTVPEKLRWVFFLNPMSAVIIAYRDIMYYGQAPQLNTLLNAVIVGIVMLIVGWFIFGKLQKRFAEEM